MDKAKLFAAAEKFISKGQNDKALEALEQILSHDAQDMKALSKASDLYLKFQNTPKAIECLKRIGQVFTRDGFYSKAVAVYKRILKLDDSGSKLDQIQVHDQLANLYAQLGLVSDAMTHFKIIVDFYDQNQDKAALLDALRKVADLDPQNLESQLRMVELFVSEQREDEAKAHLRKLADALANKGQMSDLILLYERWFHFFPQEVFALEKLIQVYLRAGEHKKALAKLQAAFRADPYNADVLELLSSTFSGMKQPEKARAVDVELVKLYRKSNDTKRLARVEDRLRGEGSALNYNASHISSATLKPESIDPGDDLIGRMSIDGDEKKILSECDVYLKYGLAEKAREVLASQMSVFPRSLPIRWKLKNVLQELRLREELVHCLSELLLLAKEQKNDDWLKLARDELKSVDPKHPSLEEVSSFDLSSPSQDTPVAEQPDSNDKEFSFSLDDEVEDDSDISIVVEDDLISKSQPQPDFVNGEGNQDDEDILLEEAERESNRKQLEKVNRVSAQQRAESPFDLPGLVPEEASAEEQSSSGTIELSDVLELQTDEATVAAEPEPKEEESAGNDFLLSDQDFTADELQALDSQLDPTASKPAKNEDLKPVDLEFDLVEEAASEAEPAVAAANHLPASPESEEVSVVTDSDFEIRQGFEEIAFFNSQGLAQEAAALELKLRRKYPDHPSWKQVSASAVKTWDRKDVELEALGTKMKLTVQEDNRSLDEDDFFDLGAELAAEDEQEEEKSSVPSEVRDVFSAFKQGVAQSVSAEDHDTHFDLGVAYREMGLIEDAIAEFELCAKIPGKLASSYYQIGLCEMARDNYLRAKEVFDQALRESGINNNEKISLSYELGEVMMKLEDSKAAAKYFSDVQKLDPTFREVESRLKKLLSA